MFETLFGAEMPLTVRFFIAFLIVLGLIGLAAWAVRRFGAGRLGSVGARGRQPRLAVIDQTAVDQRRRLILIRRDNVEHLLMIGGPSDIVVEPNIVRGVAAAREVPAPRGPGLAESLPRTVPLPETAAWQPELTPAPAPAPRAAPRPVQVPPPLHVPAPVHPPAPVHVAADDSAAWPLAPQHDGVPQRSQRETLTTLADELAARSAPAREFSASRPYAPEPRNIPAPPIPATVELPSDQTLTDMAHRLESALRRPTPPTEARVQTPAPRMTMAPEHVARPDGAPIPPPLPRVIRAAEAKPARGEAKPAGGKSMYDSLEQEMASLLGRPAGKT